MSANTLLLHDPVRELDRCWRVKRSVGVASLIFVDKRKTPCTTDRRAFHVFIMSVLLYLSWACYCVLTLTQTSVYKHKSRLEPDVSPERSSVEIRPGEPLKSSNGVSSHSFHENIMNNVAFPRHDATDLRYERADWKSREQQRRKIILTLQL